MRSLQKMLPKYYCHIAIALIDIFTEIDVIYAFFFVVFYFVIFPFIFGNFQ